MIFLAFLLPLALYLMLLGSFHRRSSPVLVSGTWDFIGLLFAGFGFLMFTGPALITSLSHRWRLFWLIGKPVGDGMEYTWYFLATCYFALVVGGSAYRFWRVRAQTAVYNVEPDQIETAVETTCEHLGLTPLRTGHLYFFPPHTALAEQTEPETHVADRKDITSHPTAPRQTMTVQTEIDSREVATGVPLPGGGRNEVTLDVDAFAAMRHVTLTWEPPSSPVRREFEEELERVLAESPTPPSDLGGTLFLLGVMLLTLTLVGSIALVVMRLLTMTS